jgi:predicted lipid carrier protein YhbT
MIARSPAPDPVHARHALPGFVRAVGARLPVLPPTVACALALTAAARRVFDGETLRSLEGKAFRIAVRDAGTSVAFRIEGVRFVPLPGRAAVDVTFAADAADFLRMASRDADPDTLFFERRLAIEGDTDTGLRLKNLLDAVEMPQWIQVLTRVPIRLMHIMFPPRPGR